MSDWEGYGSTCLRCNESITDAEYDVNKVAICDSCRPSYFDLSPVKKQHLFTEEYQKHFEITDNETDDPAYFTEWWEEKYGVGAAGGTIWVTGAYLKEIFPGKIDIGLKTLQDHEDLAQFLKLAHKFKMLQYFCCWKKAPCGSGKGEKDEN